MTHIAALLTCFNRKQKTLACLDCLYRQEGLGTLFDLSVYLVDDGSTDGTGPAVRETFPGVTVIQGTGTLFWNRGMHLAWEHAARTAHDYYLWVNDDTFLDTDAVSALLEAATAKEGQAIICTTLSSEAGDWTYGGYTLDGHRMTPVLPNGTLQACDTFNGNSVLVPDGVFRRTGNLDPGFVHAIGDLDYGLRARAAGFACFTPGRFLGRCEKHAQLPAWCRPEVGLGKRVRNLYSPLGNCHPPYFFRYEYRHFGLATAIKHYISIHLRLLVPRWWKQVSPTV